jgi:hypothetical protein
METVFLVAGSLVFLAGVLTAGFASCLTSRLIDEINERSPADQQVDTLRVTEAILRRHQQLCPDSVIRRQINIAVGVGVLTMFGGIGLFLDYSGLHDQNRNRAVAPRQQTIMGSLTAGPVGRDGYRYAFTVSDTEYSDWGTMQGPEPKIGQPVLVYYDPENPAVSALTRFEYSNRQRAWDLVLGFVILLFVTVLIPVCMIVARMRRNRQGV